MNLEIEITTDCNLKCLNCDRQCRQLPAAIYMTTDTITAFCEQCKEAGVRFDTITICGGEPLLHPNWREFAGLVSAHARALRLVTNGRVPYLESDKAGFAIWTDTGKQSPIQSFDPVNIAPCDVRPDLAPEVFRQGCWVRDCGFGMSVEGKYYCCGTAAGIDRVFKTGQGFNHVRDLLDKVRVATQLEKFCSLCGRFLSANCGHSRIDCEQFSPTWEAALMKARGL